MVKVVINSIAILLFVIFFKINLTLANSNQSIFIDRLKGYILLQVEGVGEAWYVNPVDEKRYYMPNGEVAYNIMRYFGLGVSNSDIAKILNNNEKLINRLKGRIVLQVEEHGEAYYIHPKNGTVYYLKDGDAAYELMRKLSLGITNNDLFKISQGEVGFLNNSIKETSLLILDDTLELVKNQVVKKVEASSSSLVAQDNQFVQGNDKTNDSINFKTAAEIKEINNYWLNRINSLRKASGLQELIIQDDWIKTATKWASYMAEIDLATHDRPDGVSMHTWIGRQGLKFGSRSKNGGWERNYFTENVAWNVVDGNDVQDIKQALSETFVWMVNEESYNGIHYRTMMHPDWNSLGVGVHIGKVNDNKYQVYIAIHYGNLNLSD